MTRWTQQNSGPVILQNSFGFSVALKPHATHRSSEGPFVTGRLLGGKRSLFLTSRRIPAVSPLYGSNVDQLDSIITKSSFVFRLG